jgi:Arc/MetJ-type ribon-helix-helix transcriptional regulator
MELAMSSASAPRKRRSRQAEPLRKVSYQLRESIAESVRAAVESGAAASANAFVEDAIIERLKELRRERLYAAYQEAANDPEYAAEMAELTQEFDCAVADGLSESGEGQ